MSENKDLLDIDETQTGQGLTITVDKSTVKRFAIYAIVIALGAGGGGSFLSGYLNLGQKAAAAVSDTDRKQTEDIETLTEAYKRCSQKQDELQTVVNRIALDVATLLERTKNQ